MKNLFLLSIAKHPSLFFLRIYFLCQALIIYFLVSLAYANTSIHLTANNDSSTVGKIDSLFTTDEPVNITLVLDYKKIVREKTKEPAYSPASVFLTNSESKKDSFEIKVKTRGYARRLYSYCTFPPLMLNFKKGATKNTIFQGQNKLKLVTYCSNSDINESYVMEEYLIYKIYNILTDYSYRVRLVRVTYQDINNKMKPITRVGFFIESPEKLAGRVGGKIYKVKLPNQDACDHPAIELFTLFQYMIGNTDWWVLNFHNVTLLKVPGKLPVPVPFDFDYSGAINTPYAAPTESLPIKTVRERLFRGYCRPLGTYEKSVKIFDDNKDAIYSLYQNFSYGDKRRILGALKYYDEFYKTVNDPKLIVWRIYDACEIKHTHMHQMK